MRITPIPGTPLKPSALCLGTASFGSTIGRDDAFALMDAFLEGGGNFLDTARIYADWLPVEKSVSEKTIGLWMQVRRNRDRVIVATKGAHLDMATKQPRMTRAEIESDLGGSLKSLRTDRIDLYWLHRDDPSKPVEEILAILTDQVRAGKILHFGCSNWSLARIEAAQDYARRRGLPGFVANQPMWSLAKREHRDLADPTMTVMDEAMRAYHRETGLAAIPFSSQAGGWFQKRARAGNSRDAQPENGYDSPANEARLSRVRQLAAETGLSITQIALGYLTGQPFATIPIVGCKNPAQLRDSLTAGDIRLSADQIRFLETG